MSVSLKPRIKRGPAPSGKLRTHNLRTRALPCLLRDFEYRCAYSMRHTYVNGGLRQMDIDHFNPTLKTAARNAYDNLMLAAHSCNMMKKAFWAVPTHDARSVSLLNPCKQMEYGQH